MFNENSMTSVNSDSTVHIWQLSGVTRLWQFKPDYKQPESIL